MHFNKPEHIGPYTVSLPLRKSAGTETYRVKDATGRTCFLRLIDPSSLTPAQIDATGHVIEVEISRKATGINLCQTLNTGSTLVCGRRMDYIVQSYVSGETLKDRMAREGQLTVYEVKQIATAVVNALHTLHTLPKAVVHQAVGPEHILIDLTADLKSVKLTGLSAAHYLDLPQTKPDLQGINTFYLAPECFNGVYSVQTDLYAVGALLYQLVYGRLPWYVDTQDVETLLAERNKELPLPDIERFELDEQLVNVIAKALCQDAEGRFQTADEMRRALIGEVKVERQSTRSRRILSGPNKKGAAKPQAIKPQGEGFAAVAGMEDLKEKLREEVIEPLRHPEEYRRYGVSIPNGMLLYGPPGCGKTFFAKHFAEEVGFNFLCITPATLKSRWVNATQENIAKMFKEAEAQAPTIIFIDEMNELVPNRESDVHEMSRSAVNELLAQMDRTGEKGVFIIGATNYPHMIDPAILRAGRLDNKYYIGVPDHEARRALFTLYLRKRPYDFGLDYDLLARRTEGYVSADIEFIVNTAARTALKQKSRITQDLLTQAIADTPPSLKASELARYEQIRQKVENDTPGRPRVGFK